MAVAVIALLCSVFAVAWCGLLCSETCVKKYPKLNYCVSVFGSNVWNLQLNCRPFSDIPLLSGLNQYISDQARRNQWDRFRASTNIVELSVLPQGRGEVSYKVLTNSCRNKYLSKNTNWSLHVQSHGCLDFQPSLFSEITIWRNVFFFLNNRRTTKSFARNPQLRDEWTDTAAVDCSSKHAWSPVGL
jgi:hypothetical protein